MIIKNEELIQKGKVLEAVLNVALLRGASRITYLAIPTILATTLDAEIFRRNGIGLITFDDRHMEEIVEATEPCATEKPHLNHETLYLTELNDLKTIFADMRRDMSKLLNEINEVRDCLTGQLKRPQSIGELNASKAPLKTVSADELPRFFNDNPWLDILSRRGS